MTPVFASGVFKKDNFEVVFDGKINQITGARYKGSAFSGKIGPLIYAGLTGNRNPLQAFSDEVFGAIRKFDEQDSKYELSAAFANYYFGFFAGQSQSLYSQGNAVGAIAATGMPCVVVWQWEGKNDPYVIHKGTPYFFLGRDYLLASNVDSAFLMIHNAIEEDKRNHKRLGLDFRTSPAYSVASLNFNMKDNAMLSEVTNMKMRLDEFIKTHNGRTKSQFHYSTLDSKFLRNLSLEDTEFFFVYCLACMMNIERLKHPKLLSNSFTRLRNVDILFNLSLVVDKVLQEICGKKFISERVFELLKTKKIVSEQDFEDFTSALSYDDGSDFHAASDDPEKAIPKLLACQVEYHGKSVSPLMASMLAAWNLRNYGAHSIGGGQTITTGRFPETVDILLSALFFAVDSLP
jgi:hypothetical protein